MGFNCRGEIESQDRYIEEKETKYLFRETLKDASCIPSLRSLHSNFVVVPIDKASGNVGIVCKRFYAEVLIKELGLDQANGSTQSTYEKISISSDDLIKDDCKALREKFSLEVPDSSKLLPHIYWMPKLHKTPIKFRFIIAAPNCSIKPLAKSLTKLLKLFYRQMENYNKKNAFLFSCEDILGGSK